MVTGRRGDNRWQDPGLHFEILSTGQDCVWHLAKLQHLATQKRLVCFSVYLYGAVCKRQKLVRDAASPQLLQAVQRSLLHGDCCGTHKL